LHSFEFNARLDFSSPQEAEIIVSSIVPEIKRQRHERAETIVKNKNSSVLINIKSKDKTALKASLNSCFKSIILAKEILEVK
jgi:tRNA threonylcarbamoyladenosine modification (KEOPS) complex  Pcc1 subunit